MSTVRKYGTRCSLHKYPVGTYDTMHLDVSAQVARRVADGEAVSCKFSAAHRKHKRIIIKLANAPASHTRGKDS